MRYSAVILVAGKSTRFSKDINKVYCLINNKPVFRYSFDIFYNDERCNEIIIVHNDYDMLSKFIQDIDYDSNYDLHINKKKIYLVTGGKTRNESVLNGLNKVSNKFVLVHDGARPVITKDLIDRVLNGFNYSNAVSVSLNVTDTIKELNEDKVTTLNRNNLLSVQTPQGSKATLLREVLQKVLENNDEVFDDMEAIEKYSQEIPYFVQGDKRNIKLTTVEDIEILELYLNKIGEK